jgi:hypothetical protein
MLLHLGVGIFLEVGCVTGLIRGCVCPSFRKGLNTKYIINSIMFVFSGYVLSVKVIKGKVVPVLK